MKLIIYGNGKIAKVVYEYVKNEFDIICFTVPSKLITATDLKGLPDICQKLKQIRLG